MLEDVSTPAVVLVCNRQVGLGIVRSLGRLGVPVYGVDDNRRAPAFFSRYCRGKAIWDLHGSSPEESVRFLVRLGRQLGRRSVLIPTSDIGAMFVADQADQLAEHFIFPERDPLMVRSLCNKREMYYVAKKCGVPTPETAFPRSREDVLKYLDTASFPILLKPIYNRLPGQAAKLWSMIIVHSKHELLRHYEELEDPSRPNLMLQEYIPGGDEMTWTFNGYFDREGECRVAFTGRKLRNFPPYFGQASLGMCFRNEHVEQTTIKFMKQLGYKGPLDLGYRYDARDGRYKVNDINPRVGAMFRCFVGQNGMDVVRALYQDMTGQEVTPSATPEKRKWIVEDVDLFSSICYYRDGKISVKRWLESFRRIDETTYIARDDLWPVASICMMDARRILRRAFGGRKGFDRSHTEIPTILEPTVATVASAVTMEADQSKEMNRPSDLVS
jgi:D-aspartate ligase